MTSDEPAVGQRRWLAETLRLDARLEPPPGRSITPLPAQPEDPEQAILTHALQLDTDGERLQQIRHWLSRAALISSLMLVLSFLSGFFSALGLLGDGSSTVNIIWAVAGLLGVHLLTMMLWLFSSISNFAPGGLLGQGWLWLLEHLSPRDRQQSSTGRAALGILNRSRATYWGLSLMTHSFWFAGLLGVTTGTVIALSLRSYSFNIETTILSPDVFVQVVAALGWLPSQLGFGQPEVDSIRGIVAMVEQSDVERRLWASWLLGLLLVYGLAPRLLLSAACGVLFRRRLSAFRLDLKLPAYATLLHSMMPASQRGSISDRAPASLPVNRLGQLTTEPAAPSHVVLLETDYQPPGLQKVSQVESREQRHAVLTELAATPVARLLLICNAALSPDRSSLAWLAQASWHARETGILLTGQGNTERTESWQHSLAELSLAPALLFLDSDQAVAWVNADAS